MRSLVVWKVLLVVAVLLLGTLMFSGCSDDDDEPGVIAERAFGAFLSGDQEVPPTTSPGTGVATVRVNERLGQISVNLRTRNLQNVTGAHIHLGLPGENGPILFTLFDGTGVFPSPLQITLTAADFTPGGNVTTFAEALDAIREGRTYINVHTAIFPDGAIRGQIGATGLLANLEGPENVNAGATALVTVNAQQTLVNIRLLSAGISNATSVTLTLGQGGPVLMTLRNQAVGPLPNQLTFVVGANNLTPGGTVTNFRQFINALFAGQVWMVINTTGDPVGDFEGPITAQAVTADLAVAAGFGGDVFSPRLITALPGQQITWTNVDPEVEEHTVTTDANNRFAGGPNSDTAFPNGIPQGQQYTFTVPATAVSGTVWYYHCRFHGQAGNGNSLGTGMTGAIYVP